MKKILALVLGLLLAVGSLAAFAGCGGGGDYQGKTLLLYGAGSAATAIALVMLIIAFFTLFVMNLIQSRAARRAGER